MDEVHGCIGFGAKCIIWHHKVWVLLQFVWCCDGDQEAVQLLPLGPHTGICQDTSVRLCLKVYLNDVIKVMSDNKVVWRRNMGLNKEIDGGIERRCPVHM